MSLLPLFLIVSIAQTSPEGSYAGWIETTSFTPRTLVLERSGGTLRGELRGSTGAGAARRVSGRGSPQLELEGDGVRLVLSAGDGRLAGRYLSNGRQLDMRLWRLPGHLEQMTEARITKRAGAYRDAGGRVLVLWRSYLGDLVYTDFTSGRSGTLFPLEGGELVAGPGVYRPAPTHFRARFEGDRLVWSDESAGRERIAFERVATRTREVTFRSDGIKLAGRLRLPAANAPTPGIVMNNWRSSAHYDFWAEGLSALGFATLTFDTRGVGDSASSGRPATPEDRASDCLAALEYLRAHDEVDPERVGVMSSEGRAEDLARATAADPDVAFAAIFHPYVVSRASFTRQYLERMMPKMGFAERDVRRALEYVDLATKFAVQAEGKAELARLEKRGEGQPWFTTARRRLGAPAVDATGWTDLGVRLSEDRLEPFTAIECPMLVIHGGRGPRVDVSHNAQLLARALSESTSDRAVQLLLPTANHEGLAMPADGTDGYLTTAGYPEALFRTVVEWLRAQTRTR